MTIVNILSGHNSMKQKVWIPQVYQERVVIKTRQVIVAKSHVIYVSEGSPQKKKKPNWNQNIFTVLFAWIMINIVSITERGSITIILNEYHKRVVSLWEK
jgi:hypothetical protein